jgi:serine/threonine protein phosphatase PrpC
LNGLRRTETVSVETREEFAIGDAAVRLRHAGHSHVGAVRSNNEDSFLAAPPFWIVADGMGGHAHGDLASRAAVEVFERLRGEDAASAREVLAAVQDANAAVLGLREGALSGTTLTGVAIVDIEGAGPHWMTFNVGDSRTYLWDGRRLEQQSIDHSAVQELIAAGVIAPADAAVHPQRNVVTRALGAEAEVEPDVWLVPLRGRQTFLRPSCCAATGSPRSSTTTRSRASSCSTTSRHPANPTARPFPSGSSARRSRPADAIT